MRSNKKNYLHSQVIAIRPNTDNDDNDDNIIRSNKQESPAVARKDTQQPILFLMQY